MVPIICDHLWFEWAGEDEPDCAGTGNDSRSHRQTRRTVSLAVQGRKALGTPGARNADLKLLILAADDRIGREVAAGASGLDADCAPFGRAVRLALRRSAFRISGMLMPLNWSASVGSRFAEPPSKDCVPRRQVPVLIIISLPFYRGVGFVVSVVVDHDIDDLEIRTEPAITIEGTVGLADTPPENTPEAVRHARVSINGLAPLAIRVPGKRTGNSLRFEIVTSGEIRVAAPPGVEGRYYLAAVSLGGQDITWKPVNVHAGSAPISVIYMPNAGTVTGAVESAEATEIVLIPQAALDSVDVQYGRIVPLAPGGAFQIDSVGPGTYYAFATAHFQPEKLNNPAIAGRVAAAAMLVRVTEGTTISIKPPLVWPDI